MKPWELRYATEKPWEKSYEKPMGEFDLPFELSGRQFNTALGLLTTFDDKKQMAVLRENYPELKFEEDKDGNIIVDGSAYGGDRGYLNKPGVSTRDLMQLGFNVAAFTPAGKAVTAATNVGRVAQATAATGAIQAAVEGVNTATGGGFDAGDAATNVATSMFFGGAAEGLFGVIAPKIGPALAKYKLNRGKVTPDVRESVRLALIDAGVPKAQVTEQAILGALQSIARNTGKELSDMSTGMVDDAIRSAELGPQMTPTPFRAARNQILSEQMDVPLTRGQVTEDIGQLLTEDSMRNAAMGDRAATVMRAFDAEQTKKLGEAGQRIQGMLSGGQRQIARAPDGLGIASDAVRAAERAMDAQVDAAYGRVRDAFMSPQGVRGLVQRVRQSVRGVEFIPGLEQTKSVLDEGARLTKLIDSMGGNIRPWHIKQLEAMRRRLGAGIDAAKDAQDRRQVTIMKRAFDQYLDEAIDGALFSGDTTALDALKEARSLRSTYAKKFQPQPARSAKTGKEWRDTAGELVDRIIYANPTSEEVANAMFGANRLSKNSSPEIAKRFKEILGPESAEWNAIREAAFLRLTGAGQGMEERTAQMFSKHLNEAVYGDGAPLMRELFSDAEIALFRRYAELMRKTDPFGGRSARAAFNRSGTGYTNARNVQQMLGRLIKRFAPAANVLGDPATAAGVAVAENLTERSAASAARTATQPILPSTPILPFNRFSASGLPIYAVQNELNQK